MILLWTYRIRQDSPVNRQQREKTIMFNFSVNRQPGKMFDSSLNWKQGGEVDV